MKARINVYKLIIVDDEISIRHGLAKLYPWKNMSFDLCGVFSEGKSAYNYIKSYHVDAVLCDIKMPCMDGLEFAKKVKKIRKSIKIVFLTGYVDYNYMREAIQIGVCDYITKPTDYEQISMVFKKLKSELETENFAKIYKYNKIKTNENRLIAVIKSYIDLHLEDVNLEKLSSNLKLSPNYISCIFRKETGESYSSYLKRIKMEKACVLLKDVRNTVSDIAYMLGYNNPKNFTRAFVAYYGISPSRFRKNEMIR